jgi:hypothetical protein
VEEERRFLGRKLEEKMILSRRKKKRTIMKTKKMLQPHVLSLKGIQEESGMK